MADIMDTELDQRTAMSLLSSLIQHQFANQLQQQDPLRQLQTQAAQQQLQREQQKQALVEEARRRLLGGGDAGGMGGQADNPITFGVNPRTGIAAFNNLGYVGGGEASLPDNQRAIADRYNADAMRPDAKPIYNENNVVTKTSTQLPERKQASLEQALIDLKTMGIDPQGQKILLERMFPEIAAGKLTDQQKMEYSFQKQKEAAGYAADRADQSQQAGFLRDLLKAHSTPTNPKAYESAQKAIANAVGSGMDENAVNELAKSLGFTVAGGAQPGFLRDLLGMGPSSSNIVLKQAGSPLNQILQNAGSLPEAIQATLGLRPSRGTSPVAAAEQPPKPGMVRIRDTKSGRTGWANKGDTLPSGVEFVNK